MASVIGRAPSSSVAAWNAIQAAGSNTAAKATIFIGDQRPERSRRNGIGQLQLSTRYWFCGIRPNQLRTPRGHGRSRFAEFFEEHALDGRHPGTYTIRYIREKIAQANANVQYDCSNSVACRKAHRR